MCLLGGAVISILTICTPRLHVVPRRLGVHTKVIIFGALRALALLFHSTPDHKKEVKRQKPAAMKI